MMMIASISQRVLPLLLGGVIPDGGGNVLPVVVGVVGSTVVVGAAFTVVVGGGVGDAGTEVVATGAIVVVGLTVVVGGRPPVNIGPTVVAVVVTCAVTLYDTGPLYAVMPVASMTFTPYVKVPVDEIDGVYVREAAPLRSVLVDPDIVYHWYEYGGVPPVAVAVSVSVPPVVTDVALSDTDTDGSAFTVMVTLLNTDGYLSGATIFPPTV
jgi:hypothetical protein